MKTVLFNKQANLFQFSTLVFMKSLSALSLLSAFVLPAAHAQDAGAQKTLPPAANAPTLIPLAPVPVKMRAIKIRNLPATIVAWQLDPTHNPRPIGYDLTQFKRDQKDSKSVTPALDEFAVAGRLDLLAQWVQIDTATLARELPGWNDFGALGGTRIVTPQERQTLDKLNASAQIVPVTQRIFAVDGKPAFVSYAPSLSLVQPAINPSSSEVPGTIQSVDPGILPQPPIDSLFANPPYIPNLADVTPMLLYMAPMPNMGSQPAPPISGSAPAFSNSNPYLRAQQGTLQDMLGFKFQLTPVIEDDKGVSMQLLGIEKPSNRTPYFSSVKVFEGQTAVFSIPNIAVLSQSVVSQVSRVFLIVTPHVLPSLPKTSSAPRDLRQPAPPHQPCPRRKRAVSAGRIRIGQDEKLPG